MMLYQQIKFYAVLILISSISLSALGTDFNVASISEYQEVSKQLTAGDTIILKNGEWNNFQILFKGKGTKTNPITLRAETAGKVIITGQSNLRLAGQYLVVRGIQFRNGYTPTNEVIAFRQNKSNLAYNSRVTNVSIEYFNNPDRDESDYWIAMYGKNNRFDHNSIVGKTNKGVTLAVRLNSVDSRDNHHRIDHNYFGLRPVLGSNGGETLRIGTSHYSMFDSKTLVENNLFEQCNGEVEIISVKSGANTIQGNHFERSQGTLTLRHGNGNRVVDNVFFGRGVAHTGGIRVINQDQVINNNYLEGITGYRFGGALTVMNGVPNSPVNRYMPVKNANISNNSFFNIKQIGFAVGSDSERAQPPLDSVIKNNVFYNESGANPFSVFDDISGISFIDNLSNIKNISNTKSLVASKLNIKERSFNVKRAQNGLLYPSDQSLQKYGISRELQIVEKKAVGPKWWQGSGEEKTFDSGITHHLDSADGALRAAISKAQSGDVLLLENGNYEISQILKINKVITLRAVNKLKAKLTFSRSSLFEIQDGGSLKIDGLFISGKDAPDSSGNTVIRTKKWGMTKNYKFTFINSKVADLNINHSFHFFDSGKRALADRIAIKNSEFMGVTGDILRLNKEIEDLGIYNADFVDFEANKVIDVSGMVLALYRGGTDESTFGPHLNFKNNWLKNTGHGKRNKRKTSLWLRGVQVANISNNKFENAAPINVELTVGEPITTITKNIFNNSSLPKIVALVPDKTASTVMEGNLSR